MPTNMTEEKVKQKEKSYKELLKSGIIERGCR